MDAKVEEMLAKCCSWSAAIFRECTAICVLNKGHIKYRLGMKKHIKMCAEMRLCSISNLLTCNKARLYQHDPQAIALFYCLPCGDFETETPILRWMINEKLDKCSSSKILIAKVFFQSPNTTEKLESPLPQTPMSWFSETLHNSAKKLLDLQVSVWTFCKGFFSSIQVSLPSATHD